MLRDAMWERIWRVPQTRFPPLNTLRFWEGEIGLWISIPFNYRIRWSWVSATTNEYTTYRTPRWRVQVAFITWILPSFALNLAWCMRVSIRWRSFRYTWPQRSGPQWDRNALASGKWWHCNRNKARRHTVLDRVIPLVDKPICAGHRMSIISA